MNLVAEHYQQIPSPAGLFSSSALWLLWTILLCTPQLGEQTVLHDNQSEKVKGGSCSPNKVIETLTQTLRGSGSGCKEQLIPQISR